MIWSRLKNVCCPACNSPLDKEGAFYKCTRTLRKSCEFGMTEAKFDELIKSLYRPARFRGQNVEENLSALNNL